MSLSRSVNDNQATFSLVTLRQSVTQSDFTPEAKDKLIQALENKGRDLFVSAKELKEVLSYYRADSGANEGLHQWGKQVLEGRMSPYYEIGPSVSTPSNSLSRYTHTPTGGIVRADPSQPAKSGDIVKLDRTPESPPPLKDHNAPPPPTEIRVTSA